MERRHERLPLKAELAKLAEMYDEAWGSLKVGAESTLDAFKASFSQTVSKLNR